MPSILISGANKGLGLGLTEHYAKKGWKIYACCRDLDAAPDLATLMEQTDGRVQTHIVDMLELGSITRLASQLKSIPIDILVNVAGYYGKHIVSEPGGLQEFGSSDFDEWEKTYRVNCIAPMKMAESLIENILLGEHKKIISISSIIGSIGGNDVGKMYPYRASKAGLNAVMKSMAIDLASEKITAIALHPGWVKTDMGGPTADIDVSESIKGMANVIGSLSLNDSGKFYAYDGSELPW